MALLGFRVSFVNGNQPRTVANDVRYLRDAPAQRTAATVAMHPPRD